MLILPRAVCRMVHPNNGILRLHFVQADDFAHRQQQDVFANVLPGEAKFSVGEFYWIEFKLASPR